MTRFFSLVLSPFYLGLLLVAHMQAGDAPAVQPAPVVTPHDPAFQRGALDLQIMQGAEFSIQTTSAIRPNIDYQLTVLRLGYMVDAPHGGNLLRGNNEFMLEGVGGPIFQGPGSALGGLSFIYRRNFLSPGAKVVPYLNLGVGGVYSDASHDKTQQALGSDFEFDLQASVGARFRLTPRWSVDAEFAYRHLSNAHIARRNLGTNAIGGVIGVSRSF